MQYFLLTATRLLLKLQAPPAYYDGYSTPGPFGSSGRGVTLK